MSRDLWVAVGHKSAAADLSGDAFQLLVRFRIEAELRQTDGLLNDRQVRALGPVEVPAAKLNRLLDELVDKGAIERVGDIGWQDVGFLDYCRSKAERETEREQWKERQQRSRTARLTVVSQGESRRDTQSESRGESCVLPSPSPSPSPAPTQDDGSREGGDTLVVVGAEGSDGQGSEKSGAQNGKNGSHGPLRDIRAASFRRSLHGR